MIVTRDKHEALRLLLHDVQTREARTEGENARLLAEIDWLKGQLKGAYDTIVTLRREGFDQPQPQREVQAVQAEKLPGEVQAALEAVASPNEPLWGELTQLARGALAASRDPKDVARMVRSGSTWNPYH